MGRHKALVILVVVALLFGVQGLLAPSQGRADQPRDWPVGPQPGGTYLNVDTVFPGMQAQVEHRTPIYGQANELTLKANTLLALPFLESQVDADLRLIVLSIGGSVGYRDTFQTFQYGPGDDLSRLHRLDMQTGGNYKATQAGFGEARATLALPFNDNALLLSINGLRYEGGPDRIFDWRAGIVRDSGMIFKSDTSLFFKHRSLGAAGPMFEILDFPLDGVRHTQLNYGFTVVTRPGFLRKNDLFFLSMLFNLGSTLGGYDNSKVYGTHIFYGAFTFQLAYRMVFELKGPPTSPANGGDE